MYPADDELDGYVYPPVVLELGLASVEEEEVELGLGLVWRGEGEGATGGGTVNGGSGGGGASGGGGDEAEVVWTISLRASSKPPSRLAARSSASRWAAAHCPAVSASDTAHVQLRRGEERM